MGFLSKISKLLSGEPVKVTGRKAYGAAAIAKVFKGADFPLSKHDILQKYGDKEVEYYHGEKHKLSEMLQNIPDGTYDSTAQLEQYIYETSGTMESSETTTGSGVYGAVAIAKAFKGVDFPLSKQDIIQKYGDKEVEYHMGERIRLKDILENIPDKTYNSTVDLEQALSEENK